ncbi:MAG: hypothetical protein WEB53_13160 [Akkermansiaceae bacterium]
MNRFKTLSFPLVSAVIASAALPAAAQVSMSLSSDKVYRQDRRNVNFEGGDFNVSFGDGSVSYLSACSDTIYIRPGFFRGVCAPGTSGLVTGVGLNADPVDLPYLQVTGLQGAIAVEPRKPELIFLRAAPASGLERPLGGFQDNSLSLFYNLHTSFVSEYNLTGYSTNRSYTRKQRAKFDEEIVPGAYYYSFPRLGRPNLPTPINPTIFPMAEGRFKKNNKTEGFEYTQVNDKNLKWGKNGFVELGTRRPATLSWNGLTPSAVFAATDSLFISLRSLQDAQNPRSPTGSRRNSVFPPFENGSATEPRIFLANPYVKSFTFPPIFPSGTRAIAEISLQRDFQTGGVTYDFSSRRFQIPVIFIDRYTEYADLFFKTQKTPDILADTDKDGFNNLTEWILDSNASSSTSVPATLTPVTLPPIVDFFFGPLGTTDFGFDVNRKLQTVPRVGYILQRSTNRGRTWRKFVSDANWSVENITYTVNGNTTVDIQVRSLIESTPPVLPQRFVQPPGTQGHLYRVKVVLAQKK